jgi:hypothetical protein
MRMEKGPNEPRHKNFGRKRNQSNWTTPQSDSFAYLAQHRLGRSQGDDF